MINLLRAEWIKLRTVTMNWVLGIIAIAFPLVVTLLTAYFASNDKNNGDSLDTNGLVGVLTGTAIVASLLCGVIAAASITSEFGFGTIRPTFAATPKRLKVIIAKGLIAIGFAAVALTVVQVVGWSVGSAIAEGRGATIDLDRLPTGVPAMVGAVVFAALLSLFGYGLGMITRSTPAAVAILIVWPLIAENLVAQLLIVATDNESIRNWMPLQAGFRMVSTDGFGDGPSRLTSGLYFGAVSLAIAALGAWLVNRRDA